MEFHPGQARFLSLLLVAALSRRSLEKSLPAEFREHEDGRESPGLIRCGEYSNQVLPDGRCRVVATLPHGDERRCPDLFRCTDEVSFWLHENEERKQQILELRESIAELQEELRNHRHRLKALEVQREEAAALLVDVQARVRNGSAPAEGARLRPRARHPEIQQGRNCPVDCASLYSEGLRRSGIYSVLPSAHAIPVEVLCEMDTEGGGWTVIQRRQDGSVDFNRTWNEYKEGFGDLNGEFWLGNDLIHRMTSRGDYSLRIDLEDWNNKHKHAFYQVFSIEDEENFYRLHVDGFSGTVEDSFAWYHDKRSFSTPDSGNICAEISHGGWWYHQCFFSNLNGVYYKGGRYSLRSRKLLGPDGIVWFSWKDTDFYSLRKVAMMIRPREFRPRPAP
ncbi:microfibril-associated glycoprotein 4-like [Lonchura striata]